MQKLEERGFGKEKELQQLFEANMEQLLGLRLIKSEYQTDSQHKGARKLDTLAYDDHEETFVVVEYKKDKDTNADLQLENYIEIVKEVNIRHHLQRVYLKGTSNKDLPDFNWRAVYGVCVARSFTGAQIDKAKRAVGAGGATFLLEVIRYHDNASGSESLHIHWVVGVPTKSGLPAKGLFILPKGNTSPVSLPEGKQHKNPALAVESLHPKSKRSGSKNKLSKNEKEMLENFPKMNLVYRTLRGLLRCEMKFDTNVTSGFQQKDASGKVSFKEEGKEVVRVVLRKRSLQLWLFDAKGKPLTGGPFHDKYEAKENDILVHDLPAIQKRIENIANS